MFQLLKIITVFSLVTLAACESLAASSDVSVSKLATPSNRTLEVWSWKAKKPEKGTILFGHGFNSSPNKYDAIIRQWANAGYTIHAPLHVDSEDHPDKSKYPGLTNWHVRVEDMQVLSNAFGERGYIAAGHSYGALWALVAGGAEALKADSSFGSLRDEKVQFVLALSPPGEIPVLIKKEGFSKVAVPALIQTGKKDIPPGGRWEDHLNAFDYGPETGHTHAIIYENVDHYFGGAICRLDYSDSPQFEELNDLAQVSLQAIDVYVSKASASGKPPYRLTSEISNTETRNR